MNEIDFDSLPANFTGTVYGPVFTDKGRDYRQVYEYVKGFCTDRYVTRYGYQI